METKECPKAIVDIDGTSSAFTVDAISAGLIAVATGYNTDTLYDRKTGRIVCDLPNHLVNIDELNAFAEANGGTWKR